MHRCPVINIKEDQEYGFHSWAVASSGPPNDPRREAGWVEGIHSAGEGGQERPRGEEVERDEAEEEWDALAGGGSDGEGGEEQESDDAEGEDDRYTQVDFFIVVVGNVGLFDFGSCTCVR